jgi:DEAD/DEAH box helicase domain-containing protein
MALLDRLAAGREDRLLHAEADPGSPGRTVDWPAWADQEVVAAFARAGIDRPWEHQALAADHAHARRDVVVATGTASGKSLAYLLPALTWAREGLAAGRGATALYLAPTKALAHDQLAAISRLAVPGIRTGVVDGDTAPADRAWARDHAHVVLSNPDLLHFSMLPGHRTWAPFMRRLHLIAIDECHIYRGVFGSHVAAVVRRLLRIADYYGAAPVVVACSATAAEPAAHLSQLTGRPSLAVADDASARGARTIALWQPALIEAPIDAIDEPARRSATSEAAELLADLVVEGAQTLAFIRSRRGAESVATMAREHVAEVEPGLADQVAAYRGGYLPEERRDLEQRLRAGSLTAVATTSALELGVDISGVDAVLTAGWPGTRASMWQQFGRAGRSGRDALAMFIARDDPLDSYLARHPRSLLGAPVESTVCNPENPYVLAPHLCAAASELPITDGDAAQWFGASAPQRLAELGAQGLLRRRPTGWFWTNRDRASDLADLRGTGGAPIQIVEADTGRLLGTVDRGASHGTVHEGAVYVHQGDAFLVRTLDLVDSVALVEPAHVDYRTVAQERSEVRLLEEEASAMWGRARIATGRVQVLSQVLSYQRRRLRTDELIGEHALDLPVRELETVGVWWTLEGDHMVTAGIRPDEVAGAAHAAEHASIGLLPLFASCDRWDIGGLSTDLHPDTGKPTVIVYDGFAGGAGFAEHGFTVAAEWLAATRDLIRACPCESGCPACVYSPKCGNGNNPLSKDGAIRMLDQLLSGAPARASANTSG